MDIVAKLRSQVGDDVQDAADEIERLRRRLADCVAWMDTRERQQPGMPRICDMARRVLIREGDIILAAPGRGD